MSNDLYEQFIKVADDQGIDPATADQLYNSQPPAEGEASAQPAQESGIPPELEQMIHNLPPETIQQLIAELEQEMATQQGGQQPAPQQGGEQMMMPPDQMPKQASVSEPLIKQADYVDGFIAAAKQHGFSNREIATIYKSAYEIALPDITFQQKVAALDSQSRTHLEGFITQAGNLGLNPKQAAEVYLNAINQ